MRVSDRKGQARLSIDIDMELRRRIRIAAAEKDLSIRDYVVAILVQAMEAGGGGKALTENVGWAQLSTPSFTRDWDSDEDAAYDRLS